MFDNMDGHQQPTERPLSQEDALLSWLCNNGTAEDDIVGSGYVGPSPMGATYDDLFSVPFQGTYYPYTYHPGFDGLGANDPGIGYSDSTPPNAFYHRHDPTYTHDLGSNHLYGEPTSYTDPSTDYHRGAGFTSVSHANDNTPMGSDFHNILEDSLIDMDHVGIRSEANITNSQQRRFKCQYCNKYKGKTQGNLNEHVKYTHIGNCCMWKGCGFQGTESEVREHLRSQHAMKVLVPETMNDALGSSRYKCNWKFKDEGTCNKSFVSFESVIREFYYHNRDLFLNAQDQTEQDTSFD